MNQKGRMQWGRVARASIVGRMGGEGGISGVFLHDRVIRNPVQLVEVLHWFP